MNRSLFLLRKGRALTALALVFLLAAFSFAQPVSRDINQKTNPTLLAAMADVVAKPNNYTVRVSCLGKDVALGTIVAPDGWIVTKASELKGPVECKLKDGRAFDAKLVGVQTDYDLAMLKIEATKLPLPEWRSSKEATIGSWVATPGQGADPLEVGVVSVETRPIPKEFHPNPKAGFLGVTMENTDKGVRVASVMSGTPASKAGIKEKDLIVAVDDKPIKDIPAMHAALGSHKIGDEVAIKLKRDEKEITVKATLGKRPQDRGDMQNAMGSLLSERRTNFPIVLQHDTVLKPNECGGPLVDLDGKVVGINIARAGRTESYAIPSEVVQPMLFDLMGGKYPPPADFGTGATPEERLKIAEALKARALAAKNVMEQQVKDADDAIVKAKAEIEADKKKRELAEAEKKRKDEEKKAEEKRAEEKKAEEKKAADKKAEEKKAQEKKADDKKTDEKKPEEKKPDPKKADEKKPEEKKPDPKKADEKKPEEKKADPKKPDEKKPDEKKPDPKDDKTDKK